MVMDVKMPVMDGVTAFYEIQKVCEAENWKMPAVIFCTGYAPTGRVQRIVDSSATHCLLMKPVKESLLVNEIAARLPAA